MVGETKLISLAKLSGKYVGQKFSDCSCMGLLYNWYSDLGIEVPYSFGHLNVETYFKEWKKDKKQTLIVMLKLFESLGEHAEIDDLKRHDLLAIQEKNNIYGAICLDNNTIITSHLIDGVKVIHLGKFHKVILNRRLI